MEGSMKAEDFAKEFLAMEEKDRMEVLRRIMPVFCEDMMRDEKKVQEMFLLFARDCGRPMKNMFSAMSTMMGHKGCCG